MGGTTSGDLNRTLVRLARRAETSDRDTLVRTFVAAGPLLPLLTSADHQVLFGRRGAGKTHALRYLAEVRGQRRDVALYVDMRQLGSSAGLYTSATLPLTERGTRLLVDALVAIHERLREAALADGARDDGRALPLLDLLADQITRVRVVGRVEVATSDEVTDTDESRAGLSVNLTGAGVNASERTGHRRVAGQVSRTSGVTEHSVHFGAVGRLLTEVLDALDLDRLWLLLDEWNSLPADLQPLLADLLRRCVLPVRDITVKIATVEQRTRFSVITDGGDRLGIELGADISADLNLDDALVFDHAGPAREFFAELFTRHVNAHRPSGQQLTPAEFVATAFTDRGAFTELVRAAEGVPRDALNIAIVAAERARDEPISRRDVRIAARVWYGRDKAPAAMARPAAWALLLWVVDTVIGPDGGRSFLVAVPDARHELIWCLYDARVLHVARRDVTLRDWPATRFHMYTIDYGAYVDLMAARRAARGAPSGDGADVSVPRSGPRASAVLDLAAFEASGLARPPLAAA